MITVLTGENTFEKERQLTRIIKDTQVIPERVDGSELEIRHLPDLVMGSTLFADQRLVVVKNLSQNKSLWASLADWLPRISDDIHLVLIDEKLDKRTKTYKDLQNIADIKEFSLWSERDGRQAELWVAAESKELGFEMDKKSAQTLVARIGVDQWQLYHALQKLAVLDEVTPEVIEEVIDASPAESVFNLFETALKGDASSVARMIATLQLSEDPYRLFGLMSGQAFNLFALTLTDQSDSAVAKDLGVHPFALSKLAPYAKTLGKAGAKKVVAVFIEADSAMKTSATDPWLLIERALMKVAHQK